MSYRCSECGSTDVEILLPAWCDPNQDWTVRTLDIESTALASICNACETHAPVLDDGGTPIPTRWHG